MHDLIHVYKNVHFQPPHEPVPVTYPEERQSDSNVFEDAVQDGSHGDVQPVETQDGIEQEAEPQLPPEPEPEPESGKRYFLST